MLKFPSVAHNPKDIRAIGARNALVSLHEQVADTVKAAPRAQEQQHHRGIQIPQRPSRVMGPLAQPDYGSHKGGTLLYGSRPATGQEIRFWEVSRSDSLSVFRLTAATPDYPNKRMYLLLLPCQVRAPVAAKTSGKAL